MLNICDSFNLDFGEFINSERRHILSTTGPKMLDVAFYSLKAKWFYFAILELTYVEGFRSDKNWIAQRLGLKPHVIEMALDRLFQLGALRVNEDGKWQDTLDDVTFITSENMDIQAGRQHQKQLLELAAKSIDGISGEQKDHTSLTLAFDSTLLPEIKFKIAEFRRDLNAMIREKSKNRDSVYCAQLNFFPLTQIEESESKEIPDEI